MHRRCPLNSRCPLFRASVKGGSTVYQKMKCFMQIFLEPILKQKGNYLTEKNLRVDIDNIEYPAK